LRRVQAVAASLPDLVAGMDVEPLVVAFV